MPLQVASIPFLHPERKSTLSRKSSPTKPLLRCMHVRWYYESHSWARSQVEEQDVLERGEYGHASDSNTWRNQNRRYRDLLRRHSSSPCGYFHVVNWASNWICHLFRCFYQYQLRTALPKAHCNRRSEPVASDSSSIYYTASEAAKVRLHLAHIWRHVPLLICLYLRLRWRIIPKAFHKLKK